MFSNMVQMASMGLFLYICLLDYVESFLLL